MARSSGVSPRTGICAHLHGQQGGLACGGRPFYLVGMFQESLVSSISSRLELWINSVFAWLDAPLFGHGIGSFDYAYAPHRIDHLRWLQGSILTHPNVSAGAAHNEGLQVLVELGMVGLALVLLSVFTVLRASKSSARWAALAMGTVAMVSFPFQNPATAILGVVILGVCARCE